MIDTSPLELSSGNVKAAMRDAGAKSADLWMTPLENIRVLEGFNVRTQNASYHEHIQALKHSILTHGYRRDKPLTGYVAKEGDQDVIYLTDGHSRLQAVRLANAEGAEISVLPVVTTPAGTSMADLTIGLFTSNSGKALTPLEKAEGCRRLVGYLMEEGDIATKLGLTRSYVGSLLVLAGASNAIKAMVASNEISASNAISAIRKHGAGAAAFLAGRIEEAKAGGKTKATKKTLAPPQRDLVADGMAWIRDNYAEGDAYQLAGLLAHLTGAPMADIATRLEAAVAA